jgi:ketosteroid isomerase-like protein
MSEENVEVVRRGYEAFSRGDPDAMDAYLAPTFEYTATGTIPGVVGVYRGPEGLRKFLSAFWDEFEDARIELRELIDAGDHVLASITMQGRGKRSGVEARWDIWQLWTLRDGKGVRAQAFTSRDAALEAAGLRE